MLAFGRDVEINNIGWAMTGIAERYHGHAGFLEFLRLWRTEQADAQITHTPEAVIDFGDRFVMRITITARGASSGADVSQTAGVVDWWADDAIVRHDTYWERSECSAALGLDEAAVAVSPSAG